MPALILTLFVFLFGLPLNAKTVDTCFSPRGHCDQVLVSWIDSAEHSLDAAIYNLTDHSIIGALIRAQKKGVSVRVIKDREQDKNKSDITERLRDAGVDVQIKRGSGGGLQHNKFLIIDRKFVLTGSFNWTRSAAKRTDENFVVLDDQAPAFMKEFERLMKTTYGGNN